MSPQSPNGTPTMTDKSGSSTQDVKNKAAEAAQAVKDKTGTGLDDLKSEAGRRGEDAKGQAAEEISRTSSALRKAAGEFEDGSLQHKLFAQAADQAEALSETLSNRSVDQIIESVAGFGKRNPAALIGGAVLAGLVMARFAKASAQKGPSSESPKTTSSSDRPLPPSGPANTGTRTLSSAGSSATKGLPQ